MIFAIEGVITIIVALIAFFTLTDRPETARWLNEAEKQLAIARVKSERVGTTVLLDKIDSTKTVRGIFNPVVLGTSWIFLLACITVQGLAKRQVRVNDTTGRTRMLVNVACQGYQVCFSGTCPMST